MEKKMRKILNPNLVSRKEQMEIRKSVREMLEKYPVKEEMARIHRKYRKAGDRHSH